MDLLTHSKTWEIIVCYFFTLPSQGGEINTGQLIDWSTSSKEWKKQGSEELTENLTDVISSSHKCHRLFLVGWPGTHVDAFDVNIFKIQSSHIYGSQLFQVSFCRLTQCKNVPSGFMEGKKHTSSAVSARRQWILLSKSWPFFLFNFYWNIVELQCCGNYCWKAKCLSYTHIHMHIIIFPYSLP